MSRTLRKVVLAFHLAVSVGWIGAAIAYLAMGIAAATSESPGTIRGSWIAMDLIGWYVIVPMALAAFATGVGLAAGTRWGLFRHYWVIFSLGLTAFAVVVLLLHMPSVSSTADAARGASDRHALTLGGDVPHPAIGLVVLVLVLVLNVFKPAGVTKYGRQARATVPDELLGAP